MTLDIDCEIKNSSDDIEHIKIRTSIYILKSDEDQLRKKIEEILNRFDVGSGWMYKKKKKTSDYTACGTYEP